MSDIVCFTWRSGHRNALPHVLSCLFFYYRCTSKGIIQMLLRMAIWLWMLPMDSPQPSLFLRQHCDSTMSSLFWRHFSNSFALSELYFFFTLATNIYTYQMLVYLDFFLQFHSMISNSNKITYYFYLYLYYSIFLSYPNQKCRPPIKAVYQVLCLKRLRAKAHFVKYETKLLRIFFFNYHPLHITLQLYQGFYLLENCVKLPFCL